MDNIPDFLKRLQNKITYYIYNNVNDDAANKYAEQKKKQVEVKEVKEVKEAYDSNVSISSTIVSKQSTDNGIDIDRILTELYDNFLLFIKYVLYPLLCIYLSSLVANDLIVYPVGVRIVFFILILYLCVSFIHIIVGISLFYTVRKLYEKYLNREREEMPNPPIKLMPKIFAMLPISTTTSDSSFYNFFMYPFRYLKGEKAEVNNIFLQELMKKYTDSLNESFPYYETVKGDSIFASRKEEFDKNIAEMHTIVKPKKVEQTSTLPRTIEENNAIMGKTFIQLTINNVPIDNPLPPTIDEKPTIAKNQTIANKQTVIPSANTLVEQSLPPTIE